MSRIRPVPPDQAGPPSGAHAVKAVAHVHSEWSDDASWPLSRIAATFSRRGCRVVLMSEHSRGFTDAEWDDYRQACADASTDRVVLVPGIEYGDEDNVVHIPVWGQAPFFGDALQIGDLLKQATAAGGTAVWAHPWRRAAWQRCEPSWWDYLGAVEVWNRKYHGIAPNPDSLALARQHTAAQFVALDPHTRRQLFPLSLSCRCRVRPPAGRCPTVIRCTARCTTAASPPGRSGWHSAGPPQGPPRRPCACWREPGRQPHAWWPDPGARVSPPRPGPRRLQFRAAWSRSPAGGCRGGCAAPGIPGCPPPGPPHGPGSAGTSRGGPDRGRSSPSAPPATVRS